MSSDEQKQILKMVEDGKISAEEAMTLIKALEQTSADDEVEVIETEASANPARSAGPDFEEVKARARRFAMVPLWIGIAFTVLGAYWMYVLVQSANYGFWFFLRSPDQYTRFLFDQALRSYHPPLYTHGLLRETLQ